MGGLHPRVPQHPPGEWGLLWTGQTSWDSGNFSATLPTRPSTPLLPRSTLQRQIKRTLIF